MMICSIVRTVDPGTPCSYPAGRREVYFLAPYRPCLHSSLASHDMRMSARGRTWEEAQRESAELCQRYNNCCHVDGIRYSVEDIDEDSPDRAPAGEFTSV